MKKKRLSGRVLGTLAAMVLYATLALPASGQQLQWATQAGSSHGDDGRAIAVDGEGNSYVTGAFAGTATFGVGEGNETELTSFGDQVSFVAKDIFVSKYAGGPSDIDSLIALVESFELNVGIENSLLTKLRNALKVIESPNAVNILQAFINEVEAQRGKALTDEQADRLIDGVWEIMGGL